MNAMVSRDGCTGGGLCRGICPDVFEKGGASIAAMYTQPTTETPASVKLATENGPVYAIEKKE